MQDLWRITAEERAKHDFQFFSLKPVGGFVTGDQAKGFFLQSGLAAPVLMHIWSLADINVDGKMDKKEFSIACHLISSKLKGMELPKTLPESLKADPVPSMGSFGMQPMPSSGAIVMGTMPALSSQTMMSMGGMGQLAHSSGYNTMMYNTFPTTRMANGGPGWGTMSSTQSISSNSSLVSQVTHNNTTVAASSGEWGVSHAEKLKYTQQFNAHDPQRKGFLSGVEAKSILQQTRLTHNLLAQIWGLADIDNDGKLTNEEFCLAMHLVEMAKSGQALPPKLPPHLIPPSYRRGPPPGGAVGLPLGGISHPGIPQPTSPSPAMGLSAVPNSQQTDSFGALLGGFNMSGVMPNNQQAFDPAQKETDAFKMLETFEDKRKENFDKGQAELEKRRAMLQEQLKAQEEERMAHERAEHEKRERIRQEQERKRQMELEKQMEKQRAVEQEREEQRRKAMEQREAARMELERQRQQEWERQRRDQLNNEKLREKAHVDQLRQECGDLHLELEAMDNKRSEMKNRIDQARGTVSEFTSSIEKMRVTRDQKVNDIQRFEKQVQELQQRLNMLTQQKHQLDARVQAQNLTVDDTFNSVMHSYNTKKSTLEKYRDNMNQLQSNSTSKIEEIEQMNSEMKKLNTNISSLETVNKQLAFKLKQKQTEYSDSKQKKARPARPPAMTPTPMSEPAKAKNNAFDWLDTDFNSHSAFNSSPLTVTTTSKSNDIWSGAFSSSASNTTSVLSSNTDNQDIWSSASHALSSAFAPSKKELGAVSTSPVMAAKDEDPWAKFDAEKTSVFASQNDSSTWASTFFNGARGTNPVIISGPSVQSTQVEPDQPEVYRKHRVSFTFEARHEDELALTGGEIVWVKPDQPGAEPGWVLGYREDGSQHGWFPEAYSEELPEDGTYPSFVKSADTKIFTFPDTATESDTYCNMPVDADAWSPVNEQLQQTDIMPNLTDDDNIYENINDITEEQPRSTLPQSNQSSFTAVTTSGSPTPGQVGWFPKSFVKVIGDSVMNRSTDGTPVDNGDRSTPTQPQQPSVASSEHTALTTPEQYEAIYAYSSTEPGDLSFNLGDIIQVTKKDADWWTGNIGGRSGIFPTNYVKKSDVQPAPVSVFVEENLEQPLSPNLNAQKSKQPREIATVIAPYQATGPEQLSLNIGQLINVRKKNPSGWWEGELQARGQKRKVGWFPANYVQLLASTGRGTPSDRRSLSPSTNMDGGSRSSTPVSYPQPTATPSLEQVVATFTYQAQHTDELSFSKNDIINVLNKDDPDWWKGQLNGQEGMFPANYVTSVSTISTNGTTSTSSS